MSVNETFYVESAHTGRFRRWHGASNNSTRADSSSSIPSLPTQGENARKSDFDAQVARIAFVCFLFLQGILSGLSLSALYEACTVRTPEEFFAQHSVTRMNEVRRCFFIGISWCTTGSLGISSPDFPTVSKSDLLLVGAYFSALLITLLCSRVDFQMSSIAAQLNDGTDVSSEPLMSLIEKWRAFAVPRSILCIIGWLVSCYRFVVTRGNNVHRDE